MVMALLILLGLSILIYVFFRTYKPFGGRVTADRKKMFELSPNFKQGIFVNSIPTAMDLSLQSLVTMLGEHLRGSPNRRPKKPLVPDTPSADFGRSDDVELVWFGHSAFLVRIDGRTLLLDPMLGTSPSPFPLIGSYRFSKRLPLSIEELPPIDAVLISHDHYDHLDYPSINKLKHKVGKFFVPLGVGAHLKAWGVPASRITELDWWDEVTMDGLQLTCTPSRHFSGRTLTDRFATLWCSWVIRSNERTLFFSGDTGYGPHFAQIGKAYGPFDLALLECGQYDLRWPNVHMQPEQTIQAGKDLHARRILPIHWGAFVLAFHSWTEPVERALSEASKQHLPVVTPRIGQVVSLKEPTLPQDPWWRQSQ